jgi:CheY-like chemotaxis protein
MNYVMTPQRPFLALIDDDPHSARLMTRMLLAHGAPDVSWLEGAQSAETALRALLANQAAVLPGLILVDLKASSTATAEFIRNLRTVAGSRQLVVAAVAPTLARATREALIEAGADAVFERHANIDAYRGEASNIVSYWVRNQHLQAIGT